MCTLACCPCHGGLGGGQRGRAWHHRQGFLGRRWPSCSEARSFGTGRGLGKERGEPSGRALSAAIEPSPSSVLTLARSKTEGNRTSVLRRGGHTRRQCQCTPARRRELQLVQHSEHGEYAAGSMSPPTSSPRGLPAWPSHRKAALQASRPAAWQTATTTQPRYTRRLRPAAAVGAIERCLLSKEGLLCQKRFGFPYRRRWRGRGMAATAVNTSSSSPQLQGERGVSEHEAGTTTTRGRTKIGHTASAALGPRSQL
jgi:hypothetical protein